MKTLAAIHIDSIASEYIDVDSYSTNIQDIICEAIHEMLKTYLEKINEFLKAYRTLSLHNVIADMSTVNKDLETIRRFVSQKNLTYSDMSRAASYQKRLEEIYDLLKGNKLALDNERRWQIVKFISNVASSIKNWFIGFWCKA